MNHELQFTVDRTMTSKELETTLMNAGEINSRAEKMNATVTNNPIKNDIDCLIFYPIDYHNSFDTFHFHSHHLNDLYFH